MLGAKGLKGGLRVELVTDWPDRVDAGTEIWLDGAATATRIARIERGGRVPVIYLDGTDSREAAEALAGRYLEAPEQPLPEGAYYWDELIGLQVLDPRGRSIGEVVEIFRAGGNEVYRILGPDGERLVPALRTTVLAIDRGAGTMTVADDDADEVR